MLTELSLRHFKCFELLKLPLAQLTLLSGTNATGKSTVLQGLLLLHQTLRSNPASSMLVLNGDLIQLGNVSDVVDQISGRGRIDIGVQNNLLDCSWRMFAADRSQLVFPIQTIAWREHPDWESREFELEDNVSLYNLLPIDLRQSINVQKTMDGLLRLSYISADRIGPQEAYPVLANSLHPNVGGRGEYAPGYLYQFDQKEVLLGLRYPNQSSPYLRQQVDSWMGHFFPGASISVELIPNTNMVKLLMRTSNQTDFHRPQNVGYGLTHILPIITACLGANQDDIIIIENPETHLHPAAQSTMGVFLATAVSAGLQIILETHSDHILNGIRKAVKRQVVPPEDVLIHFFAPRPEEGNDKTAQIISPLIDKNGNFDYWPPNFFDQFDKDLDDLIDWEG
ncbi:hypothetical protein MNBD_CHLOROFLEXI01-954 [hydrothermal vent metagenome]|uniref:DUF3696 domain-containing protein n=1 Tax=hydrothermal vent metagenome TaxID=652676 RepID=A0A3B0V1V2_9ZZZZ